MRTTLERLAAQGSGRRSTPSRQQARSLLHRLPVLALAPVLVAAAAAAPPPPASVDDPSGQIVLATRNPAGAALSKHAARPTTDRDQARTRGAGSAAKPRLFQGMRPLTRIRVASAFRYAVALVKRRPACADLFHRLGRNGADTLKATLYQQADPGQMDVCRRRRALAFTHVNSPVTMICPVFNSLAPSQGALALVHEALHFAGLRESPPTPHALTSKQIQDLVETRCSPVPPWRRHRDTGAASQEIAAFDSQAYSVGPGTAVDGDASQ